MVKPRGLLAAEHGDFGLGTFAGLDGEMVVLDGITYQVGRDGPVLAPPDAKVPFAVVTHFHPQQRQGLDAVASLADLQRQLDLQRGSDNEFFAVRIDGCFERVRTRTVSPWPISAWRSRKPLPSSRPTSTPTSGGGAVHDGAGYRPPRIRP